MVSDHTIGQIHTESGRPVLAGGVRGVWEAASSLQCKATALVVTVTLVVTALVSGYLLQASEKLARDDRNQQVLQLSGMLAKTVAVPLAAGRLSEVREAVSESVNNGPLLYAIVSNVEGQQLAVAQRKNTNVLQSLAKQQVPVPGRPVFRAGSDTAPVVLDVTYPITHRIWDMRMDGREKIHPATQLVGYVRAGMIADDWQRTMSSTLDLVIGVGILATVLTIPLGFFLIRRILSPLESLSSAVDRLSKGELDVRIPVRRHDEIGRLAATFNSMAEQHQSTHERIVRLNADLERRVAQRTLQLRELASREPLTGLYNRRHFNEVLERRYSEARRYNGYLSCLMIDLDDFKRVNDEFGHQVGDELLIITANTISNCLRSADVAARYGGDEFIVLLPQTDTQSTHTLAQRIIDGFSENVAERLPQVRSGISVGIASLTASGSDDTAIDDGQALIRVADNAMYRAKSAGKNRIVSASTPTQSLPT